MAHIINAAMIPYDEELAESFVQEPVSLSFSEADLLLAQHHAYQEGYAQGQKEYAHDLYEQKEQVEQLLHSIPQALQESRQELKEEIYSLTLVIMRHLFAEHCTTHERITAQINQLLEEINAQQTIELRLHPQEIKALHEGIIRIHTPHRVNVIADETLVLGGFKIKTNHGLFDASIEQQIVSLKHYLLQKRQGLSHA